MGRLLSLVFRRVLMGAVFGVIARIFGRGNARGARGVVRGVRMVNRLSRRR